MKLQSKCKNCGKEFSYYKSSTKNRGKFCSRRCKADYSKKTSGAIRVCPICKKEFYAKGNPKTKICCSKECGAKQRKTGKTIKCLLCGRETYKTKFELNRAENSFCSQLCANRYQQQTKDKDKMRANGTKSIISQLEKRGQNKLEIKGSEILKDLGVKFSEQVPMFDKFVVDVLLDEKPIVIQWDGEYWHNQKKNKQRDISQDAYLKKCGYQVLRYTDKQIKNDLQFVIKDIKEKLNPLLSWSTS